MKRLIACLLCLVLLAGYACAADISEIRGYREGEEYQRLLLGSYPYEENGDRAPLLWRVLYTAENEAVLITEYIIDVHQPMEVDTFAKAEAHKYRKVDTFPETDLYAWMNGEMLEDICSEQDFREALIEQENGKLYIFSTLEYMNEEYGFPHTKAGSSVEQPGEKVVPAAKRRMAVGTPYAKTHKLYDDWKGKRKSLYVDTNGCSTYWTSALRPYMLGIIGKNGHISWAGKGSVHVGVRPAARIDLTLLEVTGGTGTLEDPWRMEMKKKDEPQPDAAE